MKLLLLGCRRCTWVALALAALAGSAFAMPAMAVSVLAVPTVAPAVAPVGMVAVAAAIAARRGDSSDDAKNRAEQEEFLRGPIVTVALSVKPAAIESLRANPRSYVEGVMKVGKQTWKSVAVKLKGASGSFQPIDQKPCFTLNFGKYEGAERFHGLKKLHLNNANEDPSFLRQQLCGELVRAAGIPALRCTHALVSLNGRDLGLYVLTESYTKDLFAPFFDDPSGDLWEGAFCKDIDQGLTKDEGDKTDFSAIEQLLAACREEDPAQRWTKLRAILDVERFATFLALEALLCIWDGYDFYRNNYRIYQDPGTKLLCFIPHGMDQPFSRIEFDIQRPPESIVGTAFTSCPEGHTLYRARVTELGPKLFTRRDWPAEVGAASAKVLAALGRRGASFARELRDEQEALRNLVVRRITFVDKAIGELQEPLHFDQAGIARLLKGWTSQQEGAATLERVGDKSLRVAAEGECQASWRCPVTLTAGRYRFEAKVKTTGITGGGAGLRISGSEPEGEWVAGSHANHAISYEFEVPESGGDVVLVAELRATKGEALFSVGSLRLVRLK